MSHKTRLVIAIAAMAACAALAFADGAGGLLFGVVKPEWNPSFMPDPAAPIDLGVMGGYGYGVGRRGDIAGGFGLAFLDSDLIAVEGSTARRIAGGAGGMITGYRVGRERFLHLDLAARLGLGGVAYEGGKGWSGYAIAYLEPYAELGLGLTPWMRAAATVGYQVIGNLAPGRAFGDVMLRSPTLGFTLTWGNFY